MRIRMRSGIAAASLALGACGGGSDKLADQTRETAENKADKLDAAADNATGTDEAGLESTAEATRANGEAKADIVENSNLDADAMTNAQKAEITKAE